MQISIGVALAKRKYLKSPVLPLIQGQLHVVRCKVYGNPFPLKNRLVNSFLSASIAFGFVPLKML